MCCIPRFELGARFGLQPALWPLWNLHAFAPGCPTQGSQTLQISPQPGSLWFEPCYELPMSITKLQTLMQLRLGSHALPIEQGRIARTALARHLRQCTSCITKAVGDESRCVFDCPHFREIGAEFPGHFQMLRGACLCSCDTRTNSLLAIASLQRAQTSTHSRPHKPGWLNRHSAIMFSLSLSVCWTCIIRILAIVRSQNSPAPCGPQAQVS